MSFEKETARKTDITYTVKEIITLLEKEISERPPTIGLIGVSGVGKSSTINSLFKTNLQTSDTIACTKEFRDIDLSVQMANGQLKSKEVRLRVVDAPGLGEDIFKDPDYLALYQANLHRCDVILWVMSARNRAVALDQLYLQKLSDFHPKLVFGLNQADLVEPLDWRENVNIPSRTQEENIAIIQSDRLDKVSTIMGRRPESVCYSASRGWRLELLFKTILDACPPERRWIYEGLKNFSYTDFIPDNSSARIVKFFARVFSSQDDNQGEKNVG